MDKTAQTRTFFNKLHEFTNVSGRAAEKFFNPEFQKVMTALRTIDNNIRSIAIGTSIGAEKDPESKENVPGDPGKDPVALKQLIKSARSNFTRREYLQSASDLGRFHAKFDEIVKQLRKLNDNVDAVHEQFLWKHLQKEDEKESPEDREKRLEHLKHLQEMKARLASEKQAQLVKEAGIMDFFYTLGRRGRALALWQKQYGDRFKDLVGATESQVNEAQSANDLLVDSLKLMASARASRNLDAYMKQVKVIEKKWLSYDASFRKYYQTHIKAFLDKMFPAEQAQKPATEQPASTAPAASPHVPDLVVPPPKPSTTTPPDEPPPPSSPTPGGASAPVVVPDLAVSAPKQLTPSVAPPGLPLNKVDPTLIGKVPANSNDPQLSLPLSATSHQKFYATLQSLANESPRILKSFIAKYARNIQQSDPETAIKLLKISKNIQG